MYDIKSKERFDARKTVKYLKMICVPICVQCSVVVKAMAAEAKAKAKALVAKAEAKATASEAEAKAEDYNTGSVV